MKLTDLKIKKANYQSKDFRLFDGHGLYIHICRSGKYWRYKYTFAGREKKLCIGVYPEVSLKMAREAHFDARALLRQGKCPATEKQREKLRVKQQLANTFEEIAHEWYEHKRPEWSNPKHAQQVINTLTAYAFPYIGTYPISEITAMEVLNLLNRIKDRPETCTRVKQRVTAVFDYGIATGRTNSNPAQALPNPGRVKRVQHRLALPSDEITTFYRQLRQDDCIKTQLGLCLLMLTFVRSSELRNAQWSEIKGNEWHIPKERMKMRRQHIVPLSDWALEILDRLKSLHNSSFILPAKNRQKPVNENFFGSAMHRLGYKGKATPHGFRAMASTILNESGLFIPDVIERQLAHIEKNAVRAAYNRAEYLPQRHEMMQWYSDFLRLRWEQ